MALNAGLHFFADHNMRKAWVFHASDSRCAVVAVVPSDDPYPVEYGSDGEVSHPGPAGGWQRMDLVENQTWCFDMQDRAPANANVSLAPDGKIARL